MDRQSQYTGKTLDAGIARELILELFAGQTVHRDEINKRVVDAFLERGGEETEKMKQRVNEARGDLSSRYGQAKYLREYDCWEISSSPETDKASVEPSLRPEKTIHAREPQAKTRSVLYPEKTIGSGSGCVYVYSYPTYRNSAESKGETIWACKIGKTVNDPNFRVKEQTTGMPESPKIYLAIETDKPELLEKIIHNILDFRGKKKPDSPGAEWFITSPDEVEDIYQRNFGDGYESL